MLSLLSCLCWVFWTLSWPHTSWPHTLLFSWFYLCPIPLFKPVGILSICETPEWLWWLEKETRAANNTVARVKWLTFQLWVNCLFNVFSFLSQEYFTAFYIPPICQFRDPSTQEGSEGGQCLQIIHRSCKQKYNNGSCFHNGETLKRLEVRGGKWVSDFIHTNSIMMPYKLMVIERHWKEDFSISITDEVLQVINFTTTHVNCCLSLKTHKVWN